MTPRWLLAVFAVVLAGIVGVVVLVSGSQASSSPQTLEAARHSAQEAHGAVTEDEARIVADRKRASSADAVVTAIEAETPTKEEPPKEPPTGATVSSTPTGPAAPAGGWTVAYADGFGTQIGTAAGQDNTWYPNRDEGVPAGQNQKGDQPSHELQEYNSSQVSVGSEGLVLTSKYLSSTHFLSGTVRGVGTPSQEAASHTREFKWRPTEGETIAFETVARFPVNTGETEAAFWSYDPPWSDEFDFLDAWGWNSSNTSSSGWSKTSVGTVWIYKTKEGLAQANTSGVLPVDPSGGFHRYTTVVYPDNSFSQYVDGALVPWCNHRKPSGTIVRPLMGLVLMNAVWPPEGHTGGYTSGERRMTVRSVAVYEDFAYAGQNVLNPGVAPGTEIH